MSAPENDDDKSGGSPDKASPTDPKSGSKKGMPALTPEDVKLIGGRAISTQPEPPTSPPPPPPVTSPITVTANPPPPPPVTSPITVTANPPPPPPVTSPITVTANPPPPPPPPGSPNPPSPNCASPAIQVNTGVITTNEGGNRTSGYVPANKQGVPIGNSGVTIGIGVDLGSKTAASLQAQGVPASITSQLQPYFGLTGTNAQQALAAMPLNLSQADAATLSNAVINSTVSKLSSAFNNATSFADFNQLPPNTQTAIADLAYQYGDGSNLATKAPKFWGDITSGNWSAAVSELNNFGDQYSNRRQGEASLIQDDLNNYTMPSPQTPC